METTITPQSIADLLNDAFTKDPMFIRGLMMQSFRVNREIAEHPTIECNAPATIESLGLNEDFTVKETTEFETTVLGLINGFVRPTGNILVGSWEPRGDGSGRHWFRGFKVMSLEELSGGAAQSAE